MPTLFESSAKRFDQINKWEAVVANDSIGTCFSGLFIDYLLKLPAPPHVALLLYISTASSGRLVNWFNAWPQTNVGNGTKLTHQTLAVGANNGENGVESLIDA